MERIKRTEKRPVYNTQVTVSEYINALKKLSEEIVSEHPEVDINEIKVYEDIRDGLTMTFERWETDEEMQRRIEHENTIRRELEEELSK